MMRGKKGRSPDPRDIMRRRSKALLLPMPRADADALMLSYRVALEAARSGHATGTLLRRLYTMVLLTRYITEAGQGVLEVALLRNAEDALVQGCDRGDATADWTVDPATMELLTRIANEHDRQLRETRLGVLMEASDRLDRLLGQG